MKCNYCGRENPEDAAHCGECGTELPADTDTAEPLVDSEAANWILRAFGWALEQFDAEDFFGRTILVTPTREHFPDQAEDSGQVAALVFRRVQEYAGMQEWPCKLVAQDPDINPMLAPLIVIEDPPRSPAGTFSVSEGDQPEVEITYNPGQVSRPQELIATFAHELAHYLGQTAGAPPPGGEKNWEYATDLLAVYMGFGLFMANSATHFAQYSDVSTQGWSSHSLGYLSEFELVYCLTVFCALKEIPNEQVRPHLKPFLWPVYNDALEDLRRKQEVLAVLRRIRSATRSPDER